MKVFLVVILQACLWSSPLSASERAKIVVHFSEQNDTLSVTVVNVPIRRVLEELSRQTGIRTIIEGIAGNAVVWKEFHNLPFAAAIKHLLSGESYILIDHSMPRTAGTHALSRIREIRLLESNPEPSRAEFNLQEPHPATANVQAWRGSNGSSSEAAEHLLAEPTHGTAVATLIRHEDPEVRAQAVDQLMAELLDDNGVRDDSMLGLLASTVLTDDSPEVRLSALEALADTEHAIVRETLGKASKDADPQVSERARELIEDLNEGAKFSTLDSL